MTTDRLITLAARHFGVSPEGLEAGADLFEALGIDSMKALDLLTELEMELDIEIPDYELQDVRTFDDLAATIARRL